MKSERNTRINSRLLKTVFVKTLPVMAGYIVLGLGFGVLLEKNGYGIWWALAMSLFIYAGSMQCIFRKNCASVPEERSAIPLQAEQSSAG